MAEKRYFANAFSTKNSEKKAELIRSLEDKVVARDNELDEYLISVPLDEIPDPEQLRGIPDEINEVLAAVHALEPGTTLISILSESMKKVASISVDVTAGLDNVRTSIEVREYVTECILIETRCATSPRPVPSLF